MRALNRTVGARIIGTLAISVVALAVPPRAAEIGARAVTTTEAAHSGEMVIVTIPERAVKDLPKGLFAGVKSDVVVIDTGNYYPARDDRIAAIEEGQVESAWVAEQLGRPVIKVFNNIGFKSLLENGRPKGAAGRIALPVAITTRPYSSSFW